MLEQIAVTEQYRRWVDLVAGMFGGLDICGVEALVDQVTLIDFSNNQSKSQEGHIWIYEANDCGALTLLGDSQEEDRRAIAELALNKMTEAITKPPLPTVSHVPPVVTAP